jgi:hypothetical protein
MNVTNFSCLQYSVCTYLPLHALLWQPVPPVGTSTTGPHPLIRPNHINPTTKVDCIIHLIWVLDLQAQHHTVATWYKNNKHHNCPPISLGCVCVCVFCNDIFFSDIYKSFLWGLFTSLKGSFFMSCHAILILSVGPSQALIPCSYAIIACRFLGRK